MTTFERTTSDNEDFKILVTLLDAYLKQLDGDDHPFYAQFNKIDKLRHVIVCYKDGIPIGCGAFKEYDKQKVEIKRMFVQPSYRGKKIGIKILTELELWAAEFHYPECILETGKKMDKAIRLYEKAGYTIINNYPPYENTENSVCMIKRI